MTQIATVVCALGILALFLPDQGRKDRISVALWLPGKEPARSEHLCGTPGHRRTRAFQETKNCRKVAAIPRER